MRKKKQQPEVLMDIHKVNSDLTQLFAMRGIADQLYYTKALSFTCDIGELWIAKELLDLGHVVYKMPPQNKATDLKVILPSGGFIPIQVKALQVGKTPYAINDKDWPPGTLFAFVRVFKDTCWWTLIDMDTVLTERARTSYNWKIRQIEKGKWGGKQVNPFVDKGWPWQYVDRRLDYLSPPHLKAAE
jgi:hypothetical protein